MISLYRRHTDDCTKSYEKDFRIFRPQTSREQLRDCECPIAVETKLKIEGRIRNRSTKTNNWDAALLVAKQWVEWGQTKSTESKNPSIEYAVESFLATKGPKGENVKKNTLNALSILLTKRLLPYAKNNGLKLISQFQDLDVTTKFTESWTNLCDGEDLASTTKRVELERLRAFYRYCEARGWMSSNPARKLKFKTAVSEKFGMEYDEECRIFAATKLIRGDHNGHRLSTFCHVMRQAGARISDASMLNETNLVPRASGNGWAIRILQKKTLQWVYIPIPLWLADDLHNLPFTGTSNGIQYWFWTGRGDISTATGNWYTRIQKVVDKVAVENPFRHSVTPHTFRHTFAITHLNAGVDIKTVSRWMGHSNTNMVCKHYAHAILATMLASEDSYDASLQRQEEQRAKWGTNILD